MPTLKRINGEVIATGDRLSDLIRDHIHNLFRVDLSEMYLYSACLSKADLVEADLHNTDLNDADFRDANLFGANLRGANLKCAKFQGANLFYTTLSGADLREANLSGADLRLANFEGANLLGVNLRGARLNWLSHELLAHILMRAAGDDVEKRKIAGLILISKDWCWREFLRINDPLREWVASVLSQYSDCPFQV